MYHMLIALAFIGFVLAPVLLSMGALRRREDSELSRATASRITAVIVTDPVSANYFKGPRKNAGKLSTVQAARIGVAERRVIAAQKSDTVRKSVFRTVAEGKRRLTVDDLRPRKLRKVAVPRDLAQADYDAHARQHAKLSSQVPGAVPDLIRPRLVSRRGAAHYGANPKITQAQPVIAAAGLGPRRQPELVKDRVHEVAGPVPSKGASSPIRTMSAGGQPQHVDARSWIAETGHRPGPVDLVAVRPAADLADTAAVLAEAQAAIAACNFLMQQLERRVSELSALAVRAS